MRNFLVCHVQHASQACSHAQPRRICQSHSSDIIPFQKFAGSLNNSQILHGRVESECSKIVAWMRSEPSVLRMTMSPSTKQVFCMVLDARAEGCTAPGVRWKRYSQAGLSAGPTASLACSEVSTRPATQRPFCSLCSPAAQCQQLRGYYFSSPAIRLSVQCGTALLVPQLFFKHLGQASLSPSYQQSKLGTLIFFHHFSLKGEVKNRRC